MVWSLVPVDSQSGENEYYIFRPGIYKIGRKGCDIIVNKDKGVSRIHSEIIIHTMQRKHSDASKLQIKDCSKYGTFITRNFGPKEKVHESPNKLTVLKEGNLVSFGTSTTTYRFCFVPFVFWLCCNESSQMKNPVEDKVSLIGARAIPYWDEECTHVVVDELVPAKEELLEAIVAKRPFVLSSWIEKKMYGQKCLAAVRNFLPTVSVEGVSAKVVDPKARENCLKEYTFLLEASNSYFSKNKLQQLLENSGAKVFSVEDYHSNSQAPNREDNNRVICVIPNGAADKFMRFNKLSSLLRVNEIDLICAVLSGHLDPALLTSPCVIVSSSCSTDETIVADSDTENETATSDPPVSLLCKKEPFTYDIKADMSMDHISTIPEDVYSVSCEEINKSISTKKAKLDGSETAKLGFVSSVKCENAKTGITAKIEKVDGPGAENMDIIYSQELIVQSQNFPRPTIISERNFKKFRKANIQSGNSFSNLIPFSKYPYKDSEFGNEEVSESMKEEKRRKQMEAVAEDLFNSEKARKTPWGCWFSAGTFQPWLTMVSMFLLSHDDIWLLNIFHTGSPMFWLI
ncbi:hypothetical protein ACFE04_010374 [Oxalis oulophora]